MGWLVGAWDGIKLKAQYLNSDNSMILIFQYHFWNISIINTIKCIIAQSDQKVGGGVWSGYLRPDQFLDPLVALFDISI